MLVSKCRFRCIGMDVGVNSVGWVCGCWCRCGCVVWVCSVWLGSSLAAPTMIVSFLVLIPATIIPTIARF